MCYRGGSSSHLLVNFSECFGSYIIVKLILLYIEVMLIEMLS